MAKKQYFQAPPPPSQHTYKERERERERESSAVRFSGISVSIFFPCPFVVFSIYLLYFADFGSADYFHICI